MNDREHLGVASRALIRRSRAADHASNPGSSRAPQSSSLTVAPDYERETHMTLPQAEAGTPRLVGVKEMADLLDISPPTLYRLLAVGDGPPHFKLGAQIRFVLGPAFDEWTREQSQRASVS